jgi:predicted regulator of Ras-like GTPase activity (Roadblock/LC7/MglB family)
MDASAALSELVELSTQVVEVVIAGAADEVEAARTSDHDRAGELASVGEALLAEAAAVRPGTAVERVHVELERGAVVVVRDGERSITATTVPQPTAGLVAFDLRTALRRVAGDDA